MTYRVDVALQRAGVLVRHAGGSAEIGLLSVEWLAVLLLLQSRYVNELGVREYAAFCLFVR